MVLDCIDSLSLHPYLLSNHLSEEAKAGCFAIIVLQMIVTVTVLWLFLTVPLFGLQCVIVVFPDHTYFLKFYLRYLVQDS